jgi:hypothetical protein
MKKALSILLLCMVFFANGQQQDSTAVGFKKRVLESTEVDFLLSYYKQDGIHSAVSGGSGTENLTDVTAAILVAMPLSDDEVLTADIGISAYSSASSSNINPFDSTTPNPWQSSSGASQSDQLTSLALSYSASSDDRNTIWNAHVSASVEYDYSSIGFGGGITKEFNDKNTEVSLSASAYLDTWKPIYPKELQDFKNNGDNLNGGIFDFFSITGNTAYNPSQFEFHKDKKRNSYSVSLSLSQVINKKLQASVFLDVLQQQGLLSTPYQRVYFKDVSASFINNFQLANDIERLPDSRFKLPIGARLHYYINERFVLRTYYRFYSDNWGIQSHTASIELPIKLTDRFTVFPMYRYYTQTASDYFAPINTHLSSDRYYTSDYDLSAFDANQYGFGVNYTDIFTGAKIWKFGLKNIDFRYNHYDRSDGLQADIASLAFKFLMQ